MSGILSKYEMLVFMVYLRKFFKNSDGDTPFILKGSYLF
jgi:hypothetical protein